MSVNQSETGNRINRRTVGKLGLVALSGLALTSCDIPFLRRASATPTPTLPPDNSGDKVLPTDAFSKKKVEVTEQNLVLLARYAAIGMEAIRTLGYTMNENGKIVDSQGHEVEMDSHAAIGKPDEDCNQTDLLLFHHKAECVTPTVVPTATVVVEASPTTPGEVTPVGNPSPTTNASITPGQGKTPEITPNPTGTPMPTDTSVPTFTPPPTVVTQPPFTSQPPIETATKVTTIPAATDTAVPTWTRTPIPTEEPKKTPIPPTPLPNTNTPSR